MLKKFFILTGALCLVFCGLPSTNIYALEEDSIVNIEYLDDGTYYETILEESVLLERSSSKSGKKTITYKSSDGTILWSVTVHGTFTYNGKSATCTKSEVSTTCPASSWRITSSSSNRNGADAMATATAKKYVAGKVSQTKTKIVTLHCNASGKLS